MSTGVALQFKENQEIFSGPAVLPPDVSMAGGVENKKGLSASFESAAEGPKQQAPAPNAVLAAAGLETKVGTPALADQAYTAGITLTDPAIPVRAKQSELGALGGAVAQMGVEAGGQAMKYGSELLGKAFSLFGAGGDDNEQNVAARDKDKDDTPSRVAPAPAVTVSASSGMTGPGGMG